MMMTYDPVLIVLSILIAITGAYTCFHLAAGLKRARGAAWKGTLAAAAISIGGGIWSMHFVGMLAMEMPVNTTYDVLRTILSALISIGMTGIAVFTIAYGTVTMMKLTMAGLLMGSGISTMHYVGMSAVQINGMITYDTVLVVVSILIAVLASTLALWLAYRVRTSWKKIPAAMIMGVAISGMHYTGMAAATYTFSNVAVALETPSLSSATLAIAITIIAFLLFGFTFLVVIPGQTEDENSKIEPAPATVDRSEPRGVTSGMIRIPVVKNKTTIFLKAEEVVSIRAESRYSTVHTLDDEYFCSLSLTELERRLDKSMFVRVHRSHIANVRFVKSFQRRKEHGEIVIDGQKGLRIPVSRGNVGNLKSALGI